MLDKIFESTEYSMYDPEDDTTGYRVSDTRKPKLTLSVLNNLRKYREFKRNELKKRDEIVAVVYAQAPTDQGGM